MLAVKSCQNCYHFLDNDQPTIADAVSEAANYGGAWTAFQKQNFGHC